MKKKFIIILCLIFVFLVSFISLFRATAVFAQDGNEISWWTTDNGGGTSESSDGQYVLQGTIGGYNVGDLEGGEFALHGGFWARVIQVVHEYLAYLPLILR